MTNPERVTLVGAGVIGASWAVLLLRHGHPVTVTDPAPRAEDAVRKAVADNGLTGHGTAELRFETDLATAVADADVVQENGPERLEFKQQLWADIEAAAPTGALFLTSTSGLPASDVATRMQRPGRLVVGHPFNPPHVLPLVEVVPGARTDAEVVERAVAFYRSLGKEPLVLRREVPGFVANRLQSALFREAVHLVREGVVTEEELDTAVTASIGPRWAVAGPFRSFHLGGGAGGLAQFLTHLGPGMEAGWNRLGTPTLDEETVALLTRQAAESFGARPIADLAAERDRRQTAVLRALTEPTAEPELTAEENR
jgi:ketoreductase RED1